MTTKKIAVLGGYGVFGSRIVQDLLTYTEHELFVAGRSFQKAQRFCVQQSRPCTPVQCDIFDATVVREVLEEADLVILATGPFQNMRPLVLEAAIATRTHYIDIADDRGFRRIILAYVEQIKTAGIVVIPSLSTIPGISAILAKEAQRSLPDAHSVKVALSPGNKNPRGLSTVTSILESVGVPFDIREAGTVIQVPGWSGREKFTFPDPIHSRYAYFIDGPDYDALSEELDFATIHFKAGLEIDLLNHALALLSWLKGIFPVLNLPRFAWLMIQMSKLFGMLGTPFGGFQVQATDGSKTLFYDVVALEDGPRVAAIPAALAADKILIGHYPAGLVKISEWIEYNDLVKEFERREINVIEF